MSVSPLSYFLNNCDLHYYRKLFMKTANYRGSQKISFHRNQYINLILESLFHLLCEDKDTIPKSRLSNIITNFDLPINTDEFFSFLGKKDELSFLDFCCLIQSDKKNECNTVDESYTSNLFPIQIKKKSKLIGIFDDK